MGEWFGVLIAIVSSSLGGTAAAVTRYLVGSADAITLAILRWGIGFLCLLPTAVILRVRWPQRKDWLAVISLGLCFFGLFFVLYNIAVSYTTAARASLALSTLPLQTMIVGALLRIEPLTQRKTIGVCVAIFGVFAALASGLSTAPSGAWRGELIMTAAVLCMAFYNVWSRPFIQRSSALGFLTVGMGAGAVGLVTLGLVTGKASERGGSSHAALLVDRWREAAGLATRHPGRWALPSAGGRLRCALAGQCAGRRHAARLVARWQIRRLLGGGSVPARGSGGRGNRCQSWR